MNFRHFWALFVCRNLEFLRDRSSVAWNLFFPISLIAGFAFAFSGPGLNLYKVGVVGSLEQGETNSFFQTRYIRFITTTDLSTALIKVERHQLDMVIDTAKRRYWINEESPQGYVLDRMLHASDITAANPSFSKQTVHGRRIRYVDWIMPGILAMNMMFSCLFGVGYMIVRYRKNGLLKRLKATPLNPFEFLSAQIASRWWLIIASTTLVFVGTDWVIGYPMYGSYINLLLIFALGAISLISLGLLVTARTTSEEFAAGFLNIITWPMTFLSGVWFSLEGVHPFLQNAAQLAPLTHIIDAARAIMLDGASLMEISSHLLVLGLMTVIALGISVWLFRWE